MKHALGLIELNSIARGIRVTDEMLKAAQVDLIRSSTICPGKYIVIISGDVGEVEAAMRAGEQLAAEYKINRLLIPNIHEQLVPALMGTTEEIQTEAIGVLEFYSVASTIVAADIAAKAIGGKGYVTLTGDVGAVKAAVTSAAENQELLVETTVIPRPIEPLVESLL